MSKIEKLDFKKIAEIYKKKAGIVSSTCNALGISRKTFYVWRKKYPELNELLEEVEEGVIDLAEGQLLQKISDGDMTAIIFYLKTKGRHRGYVEKQEVEHSGGIEKKVVFNIEVIDIDKAGILPHNEKKAIEHKEDDERE